MAALAVLVAMGVASAGSVSLAAHDTKWTAPYHGFTDGSLFGYPSGCRVTNTISVFPVFNNSSGLALSSDSAAAHSCGASDSTDTLESDTFVVVGFTEKKSATDNLSALLSFNFKASLIATPGSPTQQASAYYSIAPAIYLFDTTTDLFWTGNSSGSFSNQIFSGSYAHTFANQKVKLWLDATLVSGDSYEWELSIDTSLSVLATPGSSSASASLNMGTGSEHGNLTSVSLT